MWSSFFCYRYLDNDEFMNLSQVSDSINYFVLLGVTSSLTISGNFTKMGNEDSKLQFEQSKQEQGHQYRMTVSFQHFTTI